MIRPGGVAGSAALGKDVAEVARDRRAVARELGRERGPVGEAHHARDAAAVFGVLRQVVALRIVQVLQAVLDAAQEDVSLPELRGRGLR